MQHKDYSHFKVKYCLVFVQSTWMVMKGKMLGNICLKFWIAVIICQSYGISGKMLTKNCSLNLFFGALGEIDP